MRTEKMDNPDYQKLNETGWRRSLTPGEEARLRGIVGAQPALRDQWEEEAALNRLLARMPAARVSSNFTARVVQAAHAASPTPAWSQRLAPFQWLSRNWMPRVALGLAMVCCGVFSFREYQAIHRAQMAREVISAGGLAALPPMEWLKDFDTINRLNKVSLADNDLLAVLH
jgi:hypothetical protein